jgi:hypothetical protein
VPRASRGVKPIAPKSALTLSDGNRSPSTAFFSASAALHALERRLIVRTSVECALKCLFERDRRRRQRWKVGVERERLPEWKSNHACKLKPRLFRIVRPRPMPVASARSTPPVREEHRACDQSVALEIDRLVVSASPDCRWTVAAVRVHWPQAPGDTTPRSR